MITAKDVEAINSTLRRAPQEYEAAMRQRDLCDDETQDILHRLELLPLTYHERARLAVRLHEVRLERRDAKDVMELLEPLMKWLEEWEPARKKMEETLGAMRKIEQKHSNRVYFLRAGEDAGKIIYDNPKGEADENH